MIVPPCDLFSSAKAEHFLWELDVDATQNHETQAGGGMMSPALWRVSRLVCANEREISREMRLCGDVACHASGARSQTSRSLRKDHETIFDPQCLQIPLSHPRRLRGGILKSSNEEMRIYFWYGFSLLEWELLYITPGLRWSSW